MTELIAFRAAVRNLLSSARTRPAKFSLRPLLYVAGAAAAAAGIYYYYYYRKKRDDEKETAEFNNTPLTEDSVKTLVPDWRSVEAIYSHSIVPEESHRNQTKKKKRKVEAFRSLHSSRRSSLEEQVKKLEELLDEAQKECRRRTRDYEAERQAHSALKTCYNNLKKTFAPDEQLLKHNPEEMYEKMMKSNEQLEQEKMDLKSQVDTLEEKLSDSSRIRDETLRKLVIGKGILTFVKTTAALQAKTLNQRAESLQESLDETQTKYNEAMQTIRNQERLQRELESEINGQQEIIHDLEEELTEIKSNCSIATAEMERLSRNLSDLDSKWNLLNDTVLMNYSELSEDHLKLFRQYNVLKEELQEITQVEAVATFKQLMVSNTQLENEKSKLMYHLHKLKGRVQQLEEMLYETDITCAVLKQERERAEEAYNRLMLQYRETFKQRNELLKASLAEAEKKLGPAVESSAQLSYVNILWSSVKKWEKELSEIRRMYDERTKERRKKWEEHHVLKTQYNEIMDILKQCDEFLKNDRSDPKSKEPGVL